MSAENNAKDPISVDNLVEDIIRLANAHGLSVEDLPEQLMTALQQIDDADPAIQAQGVELLNEFLASDEGMQIAEMIRELPPDIEKSETSVALGQAAFAALLNGALHTNNGPKTRIVDGQPIAEYSRFGITGTVRKDPQQVGRNDPCSCGSGRKFKKCCGKSK